MEVTAVVIYQGHLAHYTVTVKGDGNFEAGLLRYNGNHQNQPPQRILFYKNGRRCEGDTDKQDLMDDICDAVQQQLRGADPPLPGISPKEPYVAI